MKKQIKVAQQFLQKQGLYNGIIDGSILQIVKR